MKKLFTAQIAVGIVALIVLTVALVAYISYLNRKIDVATAIVIIHKHETATSIIKELAAKHVIKEPSWLWYYYKVKREKIQAGAYQFSGLVSPLDVMKILKYGKIKKVIINFPAGITVRAVISKLENAKVIQPNVVGEKVYPFLEGYLFPDTYQFEINQGAVSALTKMIVRFQQKTRRFKLNSKAARKILIIASLIEKEAGPAGRKKVSEVIYNRLQRHMRLDLNAALMYGLRKKHLEHSDFSSNSPYNLYKKAGLPPTPISSPSMKSLIAAYRPAKGKLLYFASSDGSTYFFSNYKEDRNWLSKKRLSDANQ